MIAQPTYVSRVRVEPFDGPLRRIHLPAEPEPSTPARAPSIAPSPPPFPS